MRKILTYKLFESNSKINQLEIEEEVKDISREFMDDYLVDIHFIWGFVFYFKPNNKKEELLQYCSDSQLELFKKESTKPSAENVRLYINQLNEKNNRYVEVQFTAPFASNKLEIYKDGIKDSFENLLSAIKSHFNLFTIESNIDSINPEIYTIRFHMIFE